MGSLRPLLPTGRGLVVVDVALATWAVVWVLLGVAIGREVRGLRQISGTVVKVGHAVQDTGAAVSLLSSVPLVGDQAKDAAQRVQDAGRSAVASGRVSRRSAGRLSWMLALAIAVIPSVPLIGLYLPLRVAALRERRRLRSLLASPIGGAELDRALAERALATLPYRRLLAVSDNPWSDVAAGRCADLAEAELARAGLARRAAR